MAKKKKEKKTARKDPAIDTTIVEQLACLEINRLILQPPFHLVSNVQWGDKGVSFDGDIEVYINKNIKKSNLIDKVPIQVKGTTIQKTILQKDKIKHPVAKEDIEVYYNHGRGVLYFVVTVNPMTYTKQAYYRILAPLELKALLSTLNTSEKDSTSIIFKKLKPGHLETLCKTFLEEVKKQPKHFIEESEKREFPQIKVNFVDVQEETFNLFEETGYMYGLSSDGIEFPLDAVKVEEFKIGNNEVVCMDGESVDIKHLVTGTEKGYKIVIEETLTLELDKKKKCGKFHLGKIKTLGSYLKCLLLIKYYIENNKFPFKYLQLPGAINEKNNLSEIEEEIESYKELINVCAQIGISENYIFHDEEDLPSLFNVIVDIFKNKQYNLLRTHQGKLENTKIMHVELSKYVKITLVYTEGEFINFYSEQALKTIGGLSPIVEVVNSQDNENDQPVALPDNWEDYYLKVSIHSSCKIEEMVKDANFNFEIVKLSFSDEHHDIHANDRTINFSLQYIDYYDKSHDEKYLEFALELNQRYLAKFQENDIAKVNIYLIKLKQGHELSGEEQNDIYDMQEKAEEQNEQKLRFACEVLLKNKVKANRIFNALDDKEKEEMLEFPIYRFYEDLK
ncbi:DUF4365 domain-containing protein [Priestia megaterium]|uniref:DUF4365 domain-containing protein n=1 Tax=Priestia megaterium TaxID=1404 RepID=UPI00203EB7A1|nr:DUF4365 domain-containing protein [Priestia megaterium]MCM3099865.1 DUF4365 domain-containing protein [Priestia megaterium]